MQLSQFWRRPPQWQQKILFWLMQKKNCAHRLANNVEKACCKSIFDAFDNKFLAARADSVVRYGNETDISLITHLKDCYAFISPIELVTNYERMCQTHDPSRPIEDLFKQMQDGRAYAQAGQQPYRKQHIINITYALIFNRGVYARHVVTVVNGPTLSTLQEAPLNLFKICFCFL
jgi:hypothetical protein